MYLFLICILLILGSPASAQVDDGLVCETTSQGIAHVSDIARSIKFLRPADDKHQLSEAHSKCLRSLEELERVVSIANDDACGEEKIELIESFHRNYISKLNKHVKLQKSAGLRAPKAVKLFFMRYASKISSLCEQRTYSIVAKGHSQLNDEQMFILKKLKRFTDVLGMSDLSKGFKSTYLFWNMVDSLNLNGDKMLGKYLDENQPRLNVQMKDALAVRTLQALCKHKLRPTYSRTMLPVLRLVDLGYYPQNGRLLDDEPQVRSLYLATQICETILPVRVFEDEKLASDQFVALKKDEAAKLPEPEPISGKLTEEAQVSAEIKPQSISSEALMDEEEPETSIKVIKANVKSRSKIVRRMLKSAVKQIKDKIGAKLGKLLFRRNSNKQLEAVDGEILMSGNLAQAEDGRRVKRSSFFQNAGIILRYLVWIIYILVLQSIKLAILFMPPLVFITLPTALLALLVEPDNTSRWLADAWVYGVDIRKFLGIET